MVSEPSEGLPRSREEANAKDGVIKSTMGMVGTRAVPFPLSAGEEGISKGIAPRMREVLLNAEHPCCRWSGARASRYPVRGEVG